MSTVFQKMIVSAFIGGLLLAAQAPKLSDGLYAELKTTKGVIVLKLEFAKAPLTVANFVGLAEGTIKNSALPEKVPYFNGSVWHRVVTGHVIQAGRPGGTEKEEPGYSFPNEIVPGLSHGRAGVLGMANSGPHTNGSQFYITLGDRSYLDGNYTVFGEVVLGMETVEKTVQGDKIEKVTIIRKGKAAKSFRADEASFRALVEQAKQQVKQAAEEKRIREAALIASRWPDLQPLLPYRILQAGANDDEEGGERLKVLYRAETLDGLHFASDEDGQPIPGAEPRSFEYIPDKTGLNRGLVLHLTMMKKGEKRLLILEAPFAYGNNGFYGKSVPGQKRFVIPPGATIVYEIERLDVIE